jgi:hypothetical protein
VSEIVPARPRERRDGPTSFQNRRAFFQVRTDGRMIAAEQVLLPRATAPTITNSKTNNKKETLELIEDRRAEA